MTTTLNVDNKADKFYDLWDKVAGDDHKLQKDDIKNFEKLINKENDLQDEASRLKLLLYDKNGELNELGKKIAGEDGEISWSEIIKLDGLDGTEPDHYISNSELLKFRDNDDSEINNGTGTDTDSKKNNETGTDTDPEINNETETDTDPETNNDPETNTDPETNNETETNNDPETNTESETNNDPETNPETETHSNSDNQAIEDPDSPQYAHTNAASDNTDGIVFHEGEDPTNPNKMDSWHIHGDGGDDGIELSGNNGTLVVENSLIEGNEGNDLIDAKTNVRFVKSTIDGGTGKDTINILRARESEIKGGEGNYSDTINVAQLLNSTVTGGDGNDQIAVGIADKNNVIDGGAGDDAINVSIDNLQGRIDQLTADGTLKVPSYEVDVHGGAGDNDNAKLQGSVDDYTQEALQDGTITYTHRITGDKIVVHSDVEKIQFEKSPTGLPIGEASDPNKPAHVDARAQLFTNLELSTANGASGSLDALSGGFEHGQSYSLLKENNFELVGETAQNFNFMNQTKLFAYNDNGKAASCVYYDEKGNATVYQGTLTSQGNFVWDAGTAVGADPITLANESTVVRNGDRNIAIDTKDGYQIRQSIGHVSTGTSRTSGTSFQSGTSCVNVWVGSGSQGTMSDGVAPDGVLGVTLDHDANNNEQALANNHVWQAPQWLDPPEFQNSEN